ncbi:MAG: hypothetical protein J6M61_07960 [Bacteroidales bacterium]|jgi:hypothetical protein|nr:hypothetical protein [Bacteroidales bacterium]
MTANDEKALREWLSRNAANQNQSDMISFKEALGDISPKINRTPRGVRGLKVDEGLQDYGRYYSSYSSIACDLTCGI